MGSSNCFIVYCVLVFMAYYAPNTFSSLLFSPGTLNGHIDNVTELLLQTVICDRDQL